MPNKCWEIEITTKYTRAPFSSSWNIMYQCNPKLHMIGNSTIHERSQFCLEFSIIQFSLASQSGIVWYSLAVLSQSTKHLHNWFEYQTLKVTGSKIIANQANCVNNIIDLQIMFFATMNLSVMDICQDHFKCSDEYLISQTQKWLSTWCLVAVGKWHS